MSIFRIQKDRQRALEASMSWESKYRPKNVKEIPVHHSKVTEVRKWLHQALSAHENSSQPGFRPFVLALCGKSGVCKSTLVEVLCNEDKVRNMQYMM